MKIYETGHILGKRGSVHVESTYSAPRRRSETIIGISRTMVINNKTFKTAYKNAILNGAMDYLNKHKRTGHIDESGEEAVGFVHKVRDWWIKYFSSKEFAVSHMGKINYKGVTYNNANFIYTPQGKEPIKIYDEKKPNTKRLNKGISNEYSNIEDSN